MPSKFGEFRFLGSKTGKRMKVDVQGQKKPAGATDWMKTTSSVTVGNTTLGNARGLVEGVKDADPSNPGTTWKCQDWGEPDAKQIVVRVREMTGSTVTSDMGYIITPNPPMGEALIGASLSIIGTSVKAHTMKTASEVKVASAAPGPWNQGSHKFIP